MPSITNIEKNLRRQKLDEMMARAETLVSTLPRQQIEYDLICLWVAITSNQIATLFPQYAKAQIPIVSGIIDSNIIIDTENGLSSKSDKSKDGVSGSKIVE